jgi:hypothetical protein
MDKINLHNLLTVMYSELPVKIIIYTRINNEKKEIKTYIGSVLSVRVEMLKNNDLKLSQIARVFHINYSKILEISAEI